MSLKPLKDNMPLINMVCIFLINLILILTIHLNWNNTVNKYLPIKHQILLFKSNLSIGHLWLEELISGDKTIDLQKDVLEKFKHKDLNNYLIKSRLLFPDVGNKIFVEKLEELKQRADIFYDLTIRRWESKKVNYVGSDIDQHYDSEFNIVVNLVDELDFLIDKKIRYEFDQRNIYFKFALVVFVVFNILVFTILYKTIESKKSYEKRLLEQKKRVETTLSSIGDAVITTNKDGKIMFLNPVAEEITGFTLKECVGEYLEFVFEIYSEINGAKVDSPVKKVLEKGCIVGLANHTMLINKYGKKYSIEDSAAPIKDDSGNILGVVLVFHDVTEQRKVQKQLIENEKFLMEQSKLASMGEMLENIAHQWRQPLSIITTAASGIKLQKELDSLDDKLVHQYIDTIEDSAKALSKTIDEFRDFFKPENEKVLINIEDILKKAFAILSEKLKYKNVKVINSCENIQAKSFSNELLQIFLSILNNSIDAFGDKFDENKYIFIEISKKDNRVIIRIKDNAGGISKKIINRVFEPYFTTKHKSIGRGLSLFIIQEMITKHMNGKIKISNKEFIHKNQKYKGAIVKIELPL